MDSDLYIFDGSSSSSSICHHSSSTDPEMFSSDTTTTDLFSNNPYLNQIDDQSLNFFESFTPATHHLLSSSPPISQLQTLNLSHTNSFPNFSGFESFDSVKTEELVFNSPFDVPIMEDSSNFQNQNLLCSPDFSCFAGHMRRVCSAGDLQNLRRDFTGQRSHSSPLVVESSSAPHFFTFIDFLLAHQIPRKMTILVEHYVSDSRIEEKKIRADELVLDGGFVVPKSKEADGFDAPDINFLGHSFRDYESGASERQQGVEEFYRMQHINQTYDFVKKMRKEYGKLNKMEMSIWECCELLNNVVDESDPDLDEPQIQHLLQTAEAIRRDYPDEDWLHLTALIHDLGKVLLLPEFGGLPQWAVVGDTFPVGCNFDSANIHHKYFIDNPDSNNTKYNTKNGVYSEGCGLDNVHMSWGHDDYMYLVAKENGTTLPHAGLFIIRYHSFYPLHKAGTYTYLMNDEDREDLKWLHVFNKYDLYSKSKVLVDVEQVKPYYVSLINKYFPAKLKW